MNRENIELLQRAVGIIEGVSFTVEPAVRDALDVAREMIDSVLDDEERA